MDVDLRRAHARAAAARRIAAAAAVAGFVGTVTAIGAGAATALATPTPDPSPTGPSPIPAPTTVEPPVESPFDGVVGGDGLGRVGAAIAPDSAPPLPTVDGFAWLVADADSGDVLAAFSPHEIRPPASTIKLLTALAAGPHLDPAEEYLADTGPESIEGSRAGIVADESYSVDDLMHGLMLASGNDAAYAIGELLGGQDAAVDLMNETAASLGAFDTNAETPHGLDTPGQVSSAYDLALIGRAAMADESLATIARTPDYAFPGRDGETFQIQNQNRLLGAYDGALGLKTGYTTQAGHTFVGAAERDGSRLIATVLAADGRAEDSAAALLDWGFAATATGEVVPVGHLVTPEDVEQAIAEADDDEAGAAGGAPVGEGADGSSGEAIHAIAEDAGGRPMVLWPAVAAMGGVLVAVLVRRRRRPVGRYAAGRR